MNDSFVREVGANTALTQPAYMLFYVLDLAETQRLSGVTPVAAPSAQSKPAAQVGPAAPQKQPLVNGHASKDQVKVNSFLRRNFFAFLDNID